jgi:hypothetical protein
MSEAATTLLDLREIARALGRHMFGDFGDADEDGSLINEENLAAGKYQVHSLFVTRNKVDLNVVTELDERTTWVYVPDLEELSYLPGRGTFISSTAQPKSGEGVGRKGQGGGIMVAKDDSIRPLTHQLWDALRSDTWPSPGTCLDFGIQSAAHFGALQHAVKYGEVTKIDLDKALGNGPALQALIRPTNPYRYVTFRTAWDELEEEP